MCVCVCVCVCVCDESNLYLVNSFAGAVGGFFGAGHPIGTSYSAISHGGPVGAWGHGFGYGLGGLYGGYGLGGHTVSHVSHGPVGLGYGGLYGHYGGYGLGGVYGHGLGGYYGHGLGGVYGHGYGLGGGYGHGYGLGGIYGHYGGYGLGGVYSHYGVGSRTVNHVSHKIPPTRLWHHLPNWSCCTQSYTTNSTPWYHFSPLCNPPL